MEDFCTGEPLSFLEIPLSLLDIIDSVRLMRVKQLTSMHKITRRPLPFFLISLPFFSSAVHTDTTDTTGIYVVSVDFESGKAPRT